jgi:hypothetical protein
MSKTFVVLTLALALLQRSIVNAQWVQTSVLNHGDVPSIAVNGSSVFAAGSGLYRSTDNGTHWQEADSGLINNLGFYPGVRTFAFSDTDIFAGTGDGVFRSTNNGANWTAVNTSIEDLSLAVIGSDLIAGTPYGWIYLSTTVQPGILSGLIHCIAMLLLSQLLDLISLQEQTVMRFIVPLMMAQIGSIPMINISSRMFWLLPSCRMGYRVLTFSWRQDSDFFIALLIPAIPGRHCRLPNIMKYIRLLSMARTS